MKCGFEIKDENQDELMKMIALHAETTHNMKEASPEFQEKNQEGNQEITYRGDPHSTDVNISHSPPGTAGEFYALWRRQEMWYPRGDKGDISSCSLTLMEHFYIRIASHRLSARLQNVLG